MVDGWIDGQTGVQKKNSMHYYDVI